MEKIKIIYFALFLALLRCNFYTQSSRDTAKSCIEAYRTRVKLLSKKTLSIKNCQEIIELLEAALSIRPNDLSLLSDLAYWANQIGQTEKAINAYEKILEIVPNNAQIIYNTGYSLKLCNNTPKAIEMYKRALEINPNYENAKFALALAHLANGDLQNGWNEYEKVQLQAGNINSDNLHSWLENNNLAGKRILVRQQGGFGDTFQFVRYVKLLKNLGAHTIVSIKKPMQKILSNCEYIDELRFVGSGYPLHDAQTTIMALPALFNSCAETIPKEIPYIFPDNNLIESWKKKLSKKSPQKNLKVGVRWIADLKNDSNRPLVSHRSIPIEFLEPLSEIKNVTFFSLQEKNPDIVAQLPNGPVIKTFGPDFDKTNGAFMDTAAIIKNLDLVLTVDTSVAHLAGALGAKVWLMLPYSTDWRWIVRRTDTPWYPNMQIFKQKKPMCWDNVIEEVVEALRKLSGEEVILEN